MVMFLYGKHSTRRITESLITKFNVKNLNGEADTIVMYIMENNLI